MSQASLSTDANRKGRGPLALTEAAWHEAVALIERNEPKGPDHYTTPIGMLAFFDSGSILAEALAAFVAE